MKAAAPPDFPPIFVVSLAQAKERREKMRERLNAPGLQYEIVDAVDGKTADPALYQNRLRQNIAVLKLGRKLLPGEIGCHLSHYFLWQRIAEEKIPCAVVLEDDAALSEDFAPVVAAALSVNAAWDVVHFVTYSRRKTEVMARGLAGKNYDLGRYKWPLGSTAGYMISLPGAQKMLAECRHISETVDSEFSKWWANGAAFYCITPGLVFPDGSESTIAENSDGWIVRTVCQFWKRWRRLRCRLYAIANPVPQLEKRQ